MEDVGTTRAEPQHLRALERANRVRLARAELKRRVYAGRMSAAEVVLAAPEETERMPISELLMSQRRWGRTRTRRLLVSLGVSENKPLGSLTERQRVALAGLLSAKKGVGPEEGVAHDEALAAAGSAA